MRNIEIVVICVSRKVLTVYMGEPFANHLDIVSIFWLIFNINLAEKYDFMKCMTR